VSRDRIERHQVWIYLASVGVGLGLGPRLADPAAATAEALVWPTLGVLLYVTFLQVPLTSLPTAGNRRFLAAVLLGNFVLIPALVWALTAVASLPPAITLGVLLVVLVPCTDWYLSFTHLTGGDTAAAVAVTPLNLLLQLLLLPLYLWLLLGETFAELLVAGTVLTIVATIIVAPLVAAFATARLAARHRTVAAWHRHSSALPVPLVAAVVFLIAASQVNQVAAAAPLLPVLTVVFGLFLVAAVAAGWLLARGLRLPPRRARAAVLSLGTRNSFVVLPLALGLPAPWQPAAVVIVYQSLVELLGLAALVWLIPRVIPGNGVPS
jgi:arsenite transporter